MIIDSEYCIGIGIVTCLDMGISNGHSEETVSKAIKMKKKYCSQ